MGLYMTRMIIEENLEGKIFYETTVGEFGKGLKVVFDLIEV